MRFTFTIWIYYKTGINSLANYHVNSTDFNQNSNTTEQRFLANGAQLTHRLCHDNDAGIFDYLWGRKMVA